MGSFHAIVTTLADALADTTLAQRRLMASFEWQAFDRPEAGPAACLLALLGGVLTELLEVGFESGDAL